MRASNPFSWLLLCAVPCRGLHMARDLASLEISGLLSPRDACSDVFGDDASNSICAPSNTLCCIRRAQQYPSCQQYLDKGWCCVGNTDTDNCYVDQESSCDEPNSVPCQTLAEGETEACCPRLTSCQPDFEASQSLVRCNILYKDLVKAAAESTQPSSSSTQASTSSPATSSPATSDPTTKPTSESTDPAKETSTPKTEDSGSHLSGGAIGGIAVAATLAAVGALLGGFMLYKRQQKKKAAASSQASYSVQPPKPAYYDANGQIVYEPVPHGYYPPAEIMTTHPPAELDATR